MLTIERLFLDLGLELDTEVMQKVDKGYIIVPKGVRFNRKDVIIDVFNKIALLHGIEPEHIFGRRRFAKYVKPKQEAIFVLTKLGYGVVEISRVLKCDHATVIYHRETIQGFTEIDSYYKNKLEKKYRELLRGETVLPLETLLTAI
jgi:chromosomal replication initiation ATPase DnaA